MDEIIKANEFQGEWRRRDPHRSAAETKVIKKGMENIEKGTCVRFVPRTHQRDYLDIQSKSG
ncbi:hypothetical protein CRUP_011333 [Coryphaenoides rupestris]|nr:hypothetical protein CRUP_011333 [Coryphaenoides rupestris]